MTAWSTLTAVHVQNAPVDATSTNPSGVYIGGDPDGSKLYHLDLSNALLYEYDLTTLYDISTMTLVQTKAMPSSIVRDIWFRPDGLKFFFIGTISIHQLSLSTPWDISTLTTGNVLNVDFFNVRETVDCPPCPLLDTGLSGLYMQPDGLAVYYSGGGGSSQGSNDRMYKQTMSIPFDLSTLSFQPLTGSFHVSENQPVGIFWKDDGSRMYVLGNDNTTISSDSVVWEYGASNFNMNSFTGGSEFQIDQEDSTPGPGIFFLKAPAPNAGSRFWVTGRSTNIIEEWAMPQVGVEKEFEINAIITKEFVEIEVNALVRNRFEKEFSIGARLVVFCDYVDTNVGWIQTDPNNQIFVDEGGFPDRIHFERVPSGGGATRRWVAKNTGKTVSGDIKFEFKFDLLDDAPVFNLSGQCTVLLADSFNHQNEAQAVGRSYIGFTLTRVRSEGRHIFFGTLSDGTTTVTTIEGGTQNQHTHEVYKQTSGGADIQRGPYFCTAELKDGKFRTSIYLDSARTQHMRGSPREVDATGINPTNLQHLIVSNPLGGGSAREVTADFDEFCFTQNEPLQIIPEKPFPAVGQFTDGWETYTLGDEQPTPWTSTSILSGASRTVNIDIHEVSDESPEEGTQAFKTHLKYIQNSGGSTTGDSRVQRVAGPAIANTDGSGIDLARFLTARQKADILSGGFNGRASGVTVSFSPISGGPSIGTMMFVLFGQGNLFGANSGRLNLNAPLGTYAGFERFDLKALLDSDSFLSNNQGVDWENHVKFVTIRVGSRTFSTGVGATAEALVNSDYISLWGTKLDIFLVDALLKVNNIEKEFDIGATLVLVDQVQLKPKMGAVLKKLDQEKEFFIGAEIGAFETEVFFSSTHFQDITPLVAGVGMENKEFTITAKVVIRTAVNSAIVSAFLFKSGDLLCIGNTGIFFQDTFETDAGWDNNSPSDIRVAVGAQKFLRFINLLSKTFGIRRAVKAFTTPFPPSIDFTWEFKHAHSEGGAPPFASEMQIELKETSNDSLTNADETTIRYRTDVVGTGGSQEPIRLEVFDNNGTNSVKSLPESATVLRDNFTFFPRITKTGNIVKLEMFIDEGRNTLAFVGVAGGLQAGVPVVQVDTTGFDMSQNLGFIYAGNYSTGGPDRQANEVFDDIKVFDSLCPRVQVNAILFQPVFKEFIISAFLTGGQDIFLTMNAILKALNQEQEFIIDALLGDINIVESTVDAFIQQQGIITIPPQFKVDALLQAQGVITPSSQPTVDAILVITIVPNDTEFTINAILGLGEFESILDVESVIGSKTGSQTVI